MASTRLSRAGPPTGLYIDPVTRLPILLSLVKPGEHAAARASFQGQNLRLLALERSELTGEAILEVGRAS